MRIVFGILEVLTMSMSTIKGISKDIVVLPFLIGCPRRLGKVGK